MNFIVQVVTDGKSPMALVKSEFDTRKQAVAFLNGVPKKILINRDGHIYRVFRLS